MEDEEASEASWCPVGLRTIWDLVAAWCSTGLGSIESFRQTGVEVEETDLIGISMIAGILSGEQWANEEEEVGGAASRAIDMKRDGAGDIWVYKV